MFLYFIKLLTVLAAIILVVTLAFSKQFRAQAKPVLHQYRWQILITVIVFLSIVATTLQGTSL